MQLKTRMEASRKEKPTGVREHRLRSPQQQEHNSCLTPEGRSLHQGDWGGQVLPMRRISPLVCRRQKFLPGAHLQPQQGTGTLCFSFVSSPRCCRVPVNAGTPHTHKHTCTHNQIKGLIPSSSIILYFKNRIREGGLSKIQIS